MDVSALIAERLASAVLPQHAPAGRWAGYGRSDKCDGCAARCAVECRLIRCARRPRPEGRGPGFKTRYIKTAYNNAVAAAKLDDVNFHTLRHTFASWAVMRGVSLKELQELLGHASLTMTMRYAHLAPERLRTAVTRLEGLTSQPASDTPTQESTQEPSEQVRL